MRVEATANPKTNVYVSAFKGNGKTVIVAINTGTTNITQQFALEGSTATSVTPYVTTESENFSAKESVNLNPDIDAFKFMLPPKSITTFVSN